MEKTVLKVDGMSCDHCVKVVTKAVGALPGIRNVLVDLKIKSVAVEYDVSQTTLDMIKCEIEDQGYDVMQ